MAWQHDPQFTEVGPEAHSDEWYAVRYYDPDSSPHCVLGASTAGVICGVSKYKTAYQLYHEMRGNLELPEDNEYMRWGRRLEPAIIAEYAERTGVEVHTPNRLYRMKECPWIGATPDGVVGSGDATYVVECKCTSFRMYDPENCRERDCFGDNPDEVPTDYLLQAQQQMLVLNACACDMPVLFDGNKLRIYTIKRDVGLCHEILTRATEFYVQLQTGEEPDPDFKHESTLDLIKKRYQVEPGTSMQLPPEYVELAQRYVDAKRDESLASDRKDMAQAELVYIMADRQVCEVPELGVAFTRTGIPATYWTDEDVMKARNNVGRVKRSEYTRFSERKLK